MKNTLKNKEKKLKLTTLGFTLIELLAVIIILAVIALIATPIVLNVVEKAKESSRQSSVAGYADAAKLYVYDEQFKGNGQVPSNEKIKENTTNQGDDVICEEVLYSSTYGIVLHGCTVGKDDTKYYFASGKTYTDKTTEPYKSIFESIKGSEEVGLVGIEIGKKVLEQFPNLALGSNGCATDNNNYSYMGGCYLKGAQASNYVWFSGFLYRIMGINSDGSVRLITQENVTAVPYNVANNINFTGSHAEKWLNEYFISNLKGTDKIVESKFCQEAISSTANLQRTDCTGGEEISEKVGLVSIDEYNLSGTESSYLNTAQVFWTMSPNSASNAWNVNTGGNAYNHGVTSTFGLRAVINVNSEVVITKGDGTLSDNYILNEDKTKDVIGNLNEKATSGEYVKLGSKVYRVVGKNNDGTTKLILDSYYQETAGTNYTMKYGSNNTFTKESGIGQKLNSDVLNWLAPDETTKSKIKTDSKWYQNPFTHGNGYTEAIKENSTPITATVGLINIGEMLSGQSASITSKINYWTLTPYTSASYAWSVLNFGYADYNHVTSTRGLRAVINVNSDVTISTGNGTLSNPYEI